MPDVSKPQGLFRRGNVWHYRRRVPLDLVEAFDGRCELKESLRTSSLAQAKQRRNLVAAKFDAQFSEARRRRTECAAAASAHSSAHDREAIARYVSAQDRERAERFESADWSSDPDATDDARHHAALLATYYSDPSHEATALGVSIAAREIFGEDIPNETNWELLRRAILELERREIRRFKGDYGAATIDHAFDHGSTPEAVGRNTPSISLQELVHQYVADYNRTKKVGVKRQEKISAALQLILQFFGGDSPVTQIVRRQCREFRDLLNELPSNMRKHFKDHSLPLGRIITEGKHRGLPPLARDTQDMYLSTLKRLLKWAKSEGHIENNPSEDLAALGDKVPDKIARDPFTTKQLTAIFDAPLYRGCIDDGPNYAKVGKNVIRRTRFWVPLLALYTGARENEICQLEAAAIRQSDRGAWFIYLNEDDEDRHIKTHVPRSVPIHPDLIRMGFLEFISMQQRAKSRRLFPDLRLSKRGYYSDAFCRWFNERLLPKIGAKTPTTTFHSFRHNFRDALRVISAPPAVVEGICGWKMENGVSNRYGSGLSVTELAKRVFSTNTVGTTKYIVVAKPASTERPRNCPARLSGVGNPMVARSGFSY